MRLTTILSVVLLLAVATAVFGETTRTISAIAVPRNDIPGLKNFAWVSPGLCRGAVPTDEGYAQLKKMGVRTIVDLRMFHWDHKVVDKMDLQCIRIHCTPVELTNNQVATFLKIVDDPRNQPVFVHCKCGSDRTGTMVASYRILRERWSPDAAIAEMQRFGFHDVFAPLVRYLSSIQKKFPAPAGQ